ncbi:MAG: hypothetical protein WAN86_03910 [Hyphomicrobiaceae bacterium]
MREICSAVSLGEVATLPASVLPLGVPPCLGRSASIRVFGRNDTPRPFDLTA